MSKNPLVALADFNQSPWYDNINRSILSSGELATMIDQDGLKGLTSNPAIFEKAFSSSDIYDEDIIKLKADGVSDPKSLFYKIAIDDIRAAADLFRPIYDATNGHDGLVSLEISPSLAYDTKRSLDEARELFQQVDRPNLMIKIPATLEGLEAVETLTSEGININATLLFSVERYIEVAKAYIRGLQKRLDNGLPIDRIASVASFFVSRVDSAVDAILSEKSDDKSLLGKAAIANAKLAYQAYQELFDTNFSALTQAGGRPQRLLWASTGVKNPDYSATYYVDTLIGHNTVNTIPPVTYQAFKEHGVARNTLEEGVESAEQTIKQINELGIDLKAVTDQLEKDGVEIFATAFESLLNALENKAKAA